MGNKKESTRLVFAVILVIFSYLYLTNNRYYVADGNTQCVTVFDKWTKNAIVIETELKE